jgi:hypothetical protein
MSSASFATSLPGVSAHGLDEGCKGKTKAERACDVTWAARATTRMSEFRQRELMFERGSAHTAKIQIVRLRKRAMMD